jgi:hypothetical protein
MTNKAKTPFLEGPPVALPIRAVGNYILDVPKR